MKTEAADQGVDEGKGHTRQQPTGGGRTGGGQGADSAHIGSGQGANIDRIIR